MRAVVYAGEGHVELAEVPDPEISEPGDAIVRVTCAAICGSDLHMVRGKVPVDLGGVMGHEAVGIVEAVGSGVERVAVGDRAVISFHIACGTCWFCARGQTSLCDDHRILGAGPFGGDLPGAQAERVRVPVADVNLLQIPPEVDDERAVFVGDVLTSGVYAAGLAAPGPDDTVAVVGVGPLGYCTVQALRAAGCDRVYAVDGDPERLRLVESHGVIPVDVGKVNTEMVLARATGDRGADVVIDAVGAPSAWATANDVVRRGGRVVVMGTYAGEVVELQLGVAWARALEIRFGGETPIHTWWDRTLQGVTAGVLDPTPLVSHRLSLQEAPDGYGIFERREATKILLVP
ncbi:MAG: alcohol dehydrogenase catalytic domain-containing protein [Actinomycetota bacterium]